MGRTYLACCCRGGHPNRRSGPIRRRRHVVRRMLSGLCQALAGVSGDLARDVLRAEECQGRKSKCLAI